MSELRKQCDHWIMARQDPLRVRIVVEDPNAGETLTWNYEQFPREGQDKLNLLRMALEQSTEQLLRELDQSYNENHDLGDYSQ